MEVNNSKEIKGEIKLNWIKSSLDLDELFLS